MEWVRLQRDVWFLQQREANGFAALGRLGGATYAEASSQREDFTERGTFILSRTKTFRFPKRNWASWRDVSGWSKKRKVLYNSHGFNYSFSSHKFVFCTLQLVLFIIFMDKFIFRTNNDTHHPVNGLTPRFHFKGTFCSYPLHNLTQACTTRGQCFDSECALRCFSV